LFYRDLSGQNEIQTVVLDAFSSQNEEVKAAASYALGRLEDSKVGRKLAVANNQSLAVLMQICSITKK